jgi:hypothetical protein
MNFASFPYLPHAPPYKCLATAVNGDFYTVWKFVLLPTKGYVGHWSAALVIKDTTILSYQITTQENEFSPNRVVAIDK